MIKTKVKRTTNNFKKLIKKIKSLSEEKVESGYFKEQGNHPEADLPYSNLMYIHEFGFGNFPPRPVREITLFQMSQNLGPVYSELKQYFSGNADQEDVLDAGGRMITQTATSLFGKSGPLIDPNTEYTETIKGFNAPLVDSGLLKHNWSWKNSIDGFLKDLNDG